ncbi:MAG: hypothetical protein ACTH5C_20935 [Pseudoalteromonas prydzensis]|uniref:hypothetical protein n=1 Tax=Pseudoalteromonas prydzensis TaxID=182141 RepID=UPI003F9E3A60
MKTLLFFVFISSNGKNEREADTEKVKFIPTSLSRNLILSDNIIKRRFGAK